MNDKLNEIFLEISSLVFASLDRDALIQQVSQRMTKKYCDFFYIILLNPNGDMTLKFAGPAKDLGEYVTPSDIIKKLTDRECRQGPANVIRCAKGEIVHAHVDGSDTDKNSIYKEVMSELGMAYSICAPLMAGTEVLGCIGLLNKASSKGLDREDLVALEEIARPVAMSFKNANLHSKLKESEQKMAAVANTVPAPIAYINKMKEITFANKSYLNTFGIDSLGPNSKLEDNIPKEVYTSIENFVDSALGGKSKTIETRFFCPDRGIRLLEVSLTPQSAANEAPGWFVLYVQDLTEIKKGQLELKRSKEEAESANLAKSRFLTNMSHEIRTPLGSMLGFSELITNYGDNIQDMKAWSSKIHNCGNHLLDIINNVLDLAKAEANKITIHPKEFNFSDFYKDIGDSFPDSNKEVELLFETNIPDDLMIKTDRTVLRQILFNLIGNALKFTEKGHVKVLADYQSAGSILSFLVKDTGLGMTKAQGKRLFMPFSQVDSSDRRKHEGTGLGLVLARKMARALGGDVELHSSELGKGTSFLVTVKVDKFKAVQKTEASLSPNVADVSRLKGARILVIDDSQDFRFLISSFFKLLGAEVESYSCGRDALTDKFINVADMTFLDLQMPEMDGYMVKEEMVKHGFKRPIIACTANAMKEDLEKIMKAGFSGYITKPLEMDTLIATALEHY